MTFQSTLIPCNTHIITTHFQWPSEHKHLANIRWSTDFSGHKNNRQKSALNSWQARGGLRDPDCSKRFTKKTAEFPATFGKTSVLLLFARVDFMYPAPELGPSLRKTGCEEGGGGSTWLFILRSNAAQGHTESAKMVAAQTEAGEAMDWWVPVSVVADKVPTRQS